MIELIHNIDTWWFDNVISVFSGNAIRLSTLIIASYCVIVPVIAAIFFEDPIESIKYQLSPSYNDAGMIIGNAITGIILLAAIGLGVGFIVMLLISFGHRIIMGALAISAILIVCYIILCLVTNIKKTIYHKRH